jgi:uncharacterized protein (TIGR01244 family)
MNISRITDNYAVAPQLRADEIAYCAELGFVTIICNRPDGEEPGQPSAAEIANECIKAGIAFHHIPVSGMPIPEAAVREHRRQIDASAGPVLGYCRSGQRSLLIWQASA